MFETLSWPVIVVAALATAIAISQYGYDRVRQPIWLLALLVIPVWFRAPLPVVSSVVVDARSGVALVLIGAWLLLPGVRTQSFRWMWADTLILALFTTQMLSQWVNELFVPFAPIEMARDLFLPYMMGRLFLASPRDIPRALPALCIAATALSLFGLLEAVGKANPVAELFGKRWDLLETAEGFRWGLKRAQGPFNHPIYMGLVLALILPWTVLAADLARRQLAPRWWLATPFLVTAAAFVTVSRSAQLSVIGVFLALIWFRLPRLRGALAVPAVLLAIPLVMFRQEAIDLLSGFVGEPEAAGAFVIIEGKEYEYSGTRHRDLLNVVYERAIGDVGWFGYGPALAQVPYDPKMEERFRSIDNHYLLQLLRYGYGGLSCFFLLAACGVWYLAREAWDLRLPHSLLAAGLCGGFLLVFLAMRGVSLESDYGWVWLFTLGVAVRLRVFRLTAQERHS